MKTLSLRAAAREFRIDRATLARIVAERPIRPAGHHAGHAVFDRDELRRLVGLEFYGSAAAILPTCDECWGPLAHHRGGKACKPGSYEEGQRLDARWRLLSRDEQRRLLGVK